MAKEERSLRKTAQDFPEYGGYKSVTSRLISKDTV